MNALVSARDKRILHAPVKPAGTAPLAPWLAFAVNVVSKSGADADLQHRPSQCWPVAATSRTTRARQDHAGKSGARDGAWNAAGELKFARM